MSLSCSATSVKVDAKAGDWAPSPGAAGAAMRRRLRVGVGAAARRRDGRGAADAVTRRAGVNAGLAQAGVAAARVVVAIVVFVSGESETAFVLSFFVLAGRLAAGQKKKKEEARAAAPMEGRGRRPR
jgi:hypothetical protein